MISIRQAILPPENMIGLIFRRPRDTTGDIVDRKEDWTPVSIDPARD